MKKEMKMNPGINLNLFVELKLPTLRSHRHLPKMSETQKSALVMETVNKENGCVQCGIVFVSSSVAVWVTFTNTCTHVECLTRLYGANNRQNTNKIDILVHTNTWTPTNERKITSHQNWRGVFYGRTKTELIKHTTQWICMEK